MSRAMTIDVACPTAVTSSAVRLVNSDGAATMSPATLARRPHAGPKAIPAASPATTTYDGPTSDIDTRSAAAWWVASCTARIPWLRYVAMTCAPATTTRVRTRPSRHAVAASPTTASAHQP